MIKVRQNVFETNSSSMHSLVIKKNGIFSNLEKLKERSYIKDGVMKIYDNDDVCFDRYPFEMLSKPERKFAYLVASYAENKEIRGEIISLYKKELGLTKIEFPTKYYDGNEPDYGHIDHQSVGLVTNYLLSNNISFKDFIFNDKYIVIIDGDEYCTWEEIKESGIINLDEIEIDINPWNSPTDEDPEYAEWLDEQE